MASMGLDHPNKRQVRGLTNGRLEKLCSLPPPGANQPQEYEPEDEACAAFIAARGTPRIRARHKPHD